jgi:NRPS condensation-like uncharacterized protein
MDGRRRVMTAGAAGRAGARHRARSGGRRRFSVADEENCYIDSPAEPNNVHLEAWVPGHLSAQRLRAAVAAVLADSPQVRIRRAGRTRWQARYGWECPPEPDIDPVSVLGWRTDAELTQARAAFLGVAPGLGHCPPFQLLLAQGPEWDSLILNAHHAALDGRSCVRLLSLIADRYSGRASDVQPAAADRGTARQGDGTVRQEDGTARQGHGSATPAPAGTTIRRTGRPARIAAQHDDGRQAAVSAYGLSLLEWPGVPASPGGTAGGQPVTVNDLLIAALAEAVARWNAARQHPPRQIRVSMPIDTRGPGRRDEFGNLSRLATIMVDPSLRAGQTAVVASQTRQAKEDDGTLVSPLSAAVAALPLPVPVKGSLARLALRSLGSMTCDTTLLSNLGNLSPVPAFGTLMPASIWFSTSAHMPRGLSVGAVSVGGRLHVCFRYRTALLDEAAGNAFAAEFAQALAALSPPDAPSAPDDPSALQSALQSALRDVSAPQDVSGLPAPPAGQPAASWAGQPAGRAGR